MGKGKLQIEYPPKSLSVEEQRVFVLEAIDKINLTIKEIKTQIKIRDRKNKREKTKEHSTWREKAKRAIEVLQLKREKHKIVLGVVNRQIKIARSTPLEEAQLFVAAAQEILTPETFNQIQCCLIVNQ